MLKMAKSFDSHLSPPPVVTKAHWRKPSHVSSFPTEVKHAKPLCCCLLKQLPVNATHWSRRWKKKQKKKKQLGNCASCELGSANNVAHGTSSAALFETLIVCGVNTAVPFVLVFA